MNNETLDQVIIETFNQIKKSDANLTPKAIRRKTIESINAKYDLNLNSESALSTLTLDLMVQEENRIRECMIKNYQKQYPIISTEHKIKDMQQVINANNAIIEELEKQLEIS